MRLDDPVVPLGGSLILVKDAELAFFVENEGARGDAVGEENAGPDGGSCADDGFAPHDGGSGIEGDVIFEGGVAFFSAESLAAGEGFGDQGNALIEFDVGSDHGGFSDDDACAVVDEEMASDLGAWVDVDAGSGVSPLGHHSRDEGDLEAVELMGHALDGDGFEEGVGEDHFVGARCGGIAVEGGFHIGGEKFADVGQVFEEAEGDLLDLALSGGGAGIEADAFLEFLAEPVGDGEEAVSGEASEVLGVDGFLVVESWEEELEEIFADGGEGSFGGEVGAVDVVDSACGAVGLEDLVPDLVEFEFHAEGGRSGGWEQFNDF